MPDTSPPSFLKRSNGITIAYHATPGKSGGRIGLVFLAGFMSDMTGAKAMALESHCRSRGRAYVRFDYSGHGESSGAFTDGTLTSWLADTLAVIDELTAGPIVLVGSSMGGWIAPLAALQRRDRVRGLVGLAAAPDFTEDLLWDTLGEEARKTLEVEGVFHMESDYGDAPYPITMAMIEDGRNHLLLRGPVALSCPVRLIHGMRDPDVPAEMSIRLAERLTSEDVIVTLVKSGDHRLSGEADIERLLTTVEDLCQGLENSL